MIADTTKLANAGPGLAVVLYLRMSDREQRLSVQQQREECSAYALSRGWLVVGEYVDAGKSGSKEIAKRVAFHAMIADAQKPGREWQAVLVWDSSRFGRLDALKGAPYKQSLREAGVWLETTKGEQIDWRTSMGRVMDALKAEQDSEFSQKLSRDVRRGRTTITQAGYLATPVPYGYDRQYVEGSAVRLVVPRREVFSKPRNWRLVPLPNGVEAAVVKWAFEQWRKRDMSLSGTIRELYERGTPSPAGEPSWTLAQVKRMLTDRVYIGDVRIGTGGKTKEVHGRIGEQHRKGHHEALVDPETFAIVGAKVREREGAEWRPKTSSGALSGVLRCGKCGYVLARRTHVEKVKEADGKTVENADGSVRERVYNYYVCDSGSKRKGKSKKDGIDCPQWRAHEAELLPVIAAELVKAIDFEAIRNIEAKPAKPAAALDQLREAVAKLKAQQERAAKNLLLVDPDNFAAAQDALSEWRREYERQANVLRLAEGKRDESEHARFTDWWQNTRPTLVVLDDRPKTPEGKHRVASSYVAPDVLRNLLRTLDVSVHLHWTQHGTRNWRLTTGVMRGQISATLATGACRAGTATATPTGSGSVSLAALARGALDVSRVPSGNRARRPQRPAVGRRVRCR